MDICSYLPVPTEAQIKCLFAHFFLSHLLDKVTSPGEERTNKIRRALSEAPSSVLEVF